MVFRLAAQRHRVRLPIEMCKFLKPTRFKLITTAVFLGAIWVVPKVTDWFLLHVIFNMYPSVVDSMKGMLTSSFEKFFREAKTGEWKSVLALYSGSRVLISAVTAYVGACIIARLAVSKVGVLQSNPPLEPAARLRAD